MEPKEIICYFTWLCAPGGFHCFRSTVKDTILTSRVFVWIYVIPLHEPVRWRCVFSKGIALKPSLRFVAIVKEGETTRPWGCRV